MTDRPERVCDLCGQFDTHPRHVHSEPGVDGGYPTWDSFSGALDHLVPEADAHRSTVDALRVAVQPDPSGVRVLSEALLGRLTTWGTGSSGNPVRLPKQNLTPAEVQLLVLADPATVQRHFDCCAAAGCPDGSCVENLAAAGGKTREALVDHVEKQVRALDRSRKG